MSKQDSKILEEKIKSFYAAKSMPDESLECILSGSPEKDGDTDKENISAKGAWFRQYYLSASVAAFLAIVLILGQEFLWQKNVRELVLAEVAMNHNKRLDPEFSTDEYQKLASVMTRLDFDLSAPAEIRSAYDLLGGRYCSIRGNIAAQLKVAHKLTGNIATFYVTPLTSDLREIEDSSVSIENAHIKLWNTSNTFYGLATDSDAT